MTTSSADVEAPALDCEQTVRLLWDYLDRQLPAVDVDAVDEHLRVCQANCASHFAFERAFLDVMHTARPRVIASDVLRARVQAILQAPSHDVPTGER